MKSTSPPKIFAADAPANVNGAVFWHGCELTVEAAINLRRSGQNIVVRGNDKMTNRRIAEQIEAGVGQYTTDKPHKTSAGQGALPHCHQVPDAAGNRVPAGHSFYEVDKTKSKKKS